MRFRKDNPAPTFSIQDVHGHDISSKSLKGKKVLLTFYRYAACALCHFRLKRIQEKATKWQKKGLVLIGVFESPPESITESFPTESSTHVMMVSDKNHKLFNLFHIKNSWWAVFASLLDPLFYAAHFRYLGRLLFGKKDGNLAQIPADFLINEDGTFYDVHYGKTISDHIPIELIDEFVDA